MGSCDSSKKKSDESLDSVLQLNPQTLVKLGSVDPRYQSYNVEMVEVVGGEFWKPYKLMDSLPSGNSMSGYDVSQKNEDLYHKLTPIDLKNKRLLALARGLAPAYVRVSGTWANASYFQDDDRAQLTKAPAGYVNILTRKHWKSVVEFVKATDSKLVTSFAVSNGVRDAQGLWTPQQAQQLLDYTQSLGGEIAAAELFNEPNMPTAGGEMPVDYDANSYAKDVAVYTQWAKSKAPNMLTLGPGSVGEGMPGVTMDLPNMRFVSSEDMLQAEPKPQFDVFSYHFYGAVSIRALDSGPFTIKAENALTHSWLQRTADAADYNLKLRDQFMPGKAVWITETAQAAGGADPYAATYLDSFRYLFQLGTLAKKGVQVVMHNTLAASEYSLIEQDSFLPKPNYWAALLWARFMGTEVYEAGDSAAQGVYVFAHNLKGNNEGIAYLIVNTTDAAHKVQLESAATQYTLTSDQLQGTRVFLNGVELALTAADALPELKGQPVKKGQASVPALSLTFFTVQ